MRHPSPDDDAELDIARGPRAPVRQKLVRDVMATRPKTLVASASVDDARSVLADNHVHMVLLTRGATLLGTLIRADLPPSAPGDGPALSWSTLSGRTSDPEAPAAPVRECLVRMGLRRLAVTDVEGSLLGLLCLKSSGAGFCSDDDITSRAMATTTDHGAPR